MNSEICSEAQEQAQKWNRNMLRSLKMDLRLRDFKKILAEIYVKAHTITQPRSVVRSTECKVLQLPPCSCHMSVRKVNFLVNASSGFFSGERFKKH